MDPLLRSHAIDPHFMRADDFDGFMKARAEGLLSLIETAMGKPLPREQSSGTGAEKIEESIEERLESLEEAVPGP